jgi:hypothetical protein
MLQLQTDLIEFTFRFKLLADSISALERHVSMDLYQVVERGVAPEEADRIITILRLNHQELVRMQNELESCQLLSEQALRSLGFDPPKPINDWLEQKQPPTGQ